MENLSCGELYSYFRHWHLDMLICLWIELYLIFGYFFQIQMLKIFVDWLMIYFFCHLEALLSVLGLEMSMKRFQNENLVTEIRFNWINYIAFWFMRWIISFTGWRFVGWSVCSQIRKTIPLLWIFICHVVMILKVNFIHTFFKLVRYVDFSSKQKWFLNQWWANGRQLRRTLWSLLWIFIFISLIP